jgi:hypothetical protein
MEMGASMALLFISYCDVMIVYFECFVIQVLLVNIDNNLKLRCEILFKKTQVVQVQFLVT